MQDNPVLQQIWQEHDYREDAQYYGVYIFGNGPMADYGVTGQKAPWLRDVEGVDLDAGKPSARTISSGLHRRCDG